MPLGAIHDNDTSSAHSDQSITTPSTSPPCAAEDMDSPYKKGPHAIPEPLNLANTSSDAETLDPAIATPSCESFPSGPPTLTTKDAPQLPDGGAPSPATSVVYAGVHQEVVEEKAAEKAVEEEGKVTVEIEQEEEEEEITGGVAHKRVSALDDVLVGTRVSEGHENFVTAYNMLTGIRYAVSRCNAKIKRDLLESDFTTTTEMSFDMSGQGDTVSSKYMFRFKDYAPWVFRHLRELFGLDPADYLMSMTAKYIVSELGSPGKSGSFFYYSRDYRFIIKTIRHSEHKQLRRILKIYYQHVRDNPNTLISQFYGLHRVRLPFGRKIHFVVMNNVFPALHEIHRRYDLKGSTLGRAYHREDEKHMVVLKDLDWLQNHERIVLGPEKRALFMRQLELDVQMLQRANVMDYSLLIGIHDKSKGNSAMSALTRFKQFGPGSDTGTDPARRVRRRQQEQDEFSRLQRQLQDANPTALTDFQFDEQFRSQFAFYRDSGGFQSTDPQNEPRDIFYYMGIIDFLTEYSFRKRVETFCKSLVHRRSELSAVPAFEYGDRFFRFLCLAVGSPIERKERKRRSEEAAVATRTNEEPPAAPQTNGDEAATRLTPSATPDAHSPSLVRVLSNASNASNGSRATAVSKSNSGSTAARPQIPEQSSRASIIAYR